jgi:hypothetical protein
MTSNGCQYTWRSLVRCIKNFSHIGSRLLLARASANFKDFSWVIYTFDAMTSTRSNECQCDVVLAEMAAHWPHFAPQSELNSLIKVGEKARTGDGRLGPLPGEFMLPLQGDGVHIKNGQPNVSSARSSC